MAAVTLHRVHGTGAGPWVPQAGVDSANPLGLRGSECTDHIVLFMISLYIY
jgi:hypothetical protein